MRSLALTSGILAGVPRPPLLSVLDLSPIPSGRDARFALESTLALAVHVEALGFTRFWVAEHHNSAGLASATPEILVARIASLTARIQVGTGGIMLGNHSPLRIAETFRLLSALFPGRVDLGVGRAAGTDKKTALALRRSPGLLGEALFAEQLEELERWLGSSATPDVPFGPVKAVPTGVPSPALFVLGSSEESAAYAGERGLGYAFAHHMNPDGTVAALARYRERFVARGARLEPHGIVSVSAICAPTDEAARALATSGELQWLRFGQGFRDAPLPSPEEAARYPYDEAELTLRAGMRERAIVGAPASVKRALDELQRASGADELMLLSAVHDPAARRTSFGLIAEAFALTARP